MPDPSSHFDPRAEELFRRYLADLALGLKPDFEALCRQHGERERDLRELKRAIDLAERFKPESFIHTPLSERLKKEFGPQTDPTLTLEPEPEPDSGSSSKTLDRLRTEAPRGTRYKLLGELARGGMGAIIKIWDGELRRTLAMKVVLDRGEGSTSGGPAGTARTLDRFLEEAQVTGQLDHPGIVPVHELGLGADGRVYFTMRLVKGEDLSKIFQHVHTGHDGWSQLRALGVILKVCEAMSYAHSKKVVHRDLKPGNVMVGKFGEVYVMDWGLARVLGRADKHDLRLQPQPQSSFSAVKTDRKESAGYSPDSPLITMDGDIVGTPSYMAPEQAKGQLDKLGEHSDVYAVGAMLYGLVAGEMPYVPRNARVSARTILISVLNGPPRPLHEIAPQTAAELVAIVDKAMAREIEDRYLTMRALGDDLRAYIEGRVVKAYETGAWAEARKWVKRNKPLAAALAAAVLIAVIGAISFAIKADQATISAVLARNEAARADTKSREAEQKTNDVLSLSASRDLEELVARAEQLWPPHPAMIPEYEKWLADARALIEGRPADPLHGIKKRPGLEEHKAKLAELRQRATKPTEADATADRLSHPRFHELKEKRAELTWRSRMLGLEAWPSEADVEAQLAKETLPSDANKLDLLSWPLIGPERPLYGEELKGLLLMRRALALASDIQRPAIRSGLAWANFRLGRLDEAVSESERALDAAPSDRKQEFESYLAQVEKEVERWRGDSALADRRKERDALIAEISDLDRTLGERRTWAFANPEDSWWQLRLSKLVSDLEALRDPKRGLLGDTLAEPFGWGVQKRYEFANSIRDRSLDGPQAKKRWADAITAIGSSPKYGGLKLPAQLGLVPIGADPTSGLWEFWQVETGVEPMRDSDGKLVLSEDMGLVLVLIPGGSFWMGRQKTDEHDRNFDPASWPDDGPVHEVELTPYFLSKFEMTQGQWLRIAGSNPSQYGPTQTFAGHQNNFLHPVENVSWIECMESMMRVGLALPSEAQWENGCRAGTETSWWTGQDRESLRGKVNLADKSGGRRRRELGRHQGLA